MRNMLTASEEPDDKGCCYPCYAKRCLQCVPEMTRVGGVSSVMPDGCCRGHLRRFSSGLFSKLNLSLIFSLLYFHDVCDLNQKQPNGSILHGLQE